MKPRQPWLAVAGAVLLLALGGCGFHLEGRMPLPRSLAVVRIEAVDTQSDFYFGLRKSLIASGATIDDDDADSSAAVIRITADATSERTLSVSTLNVPNQYELTYRMKFSVESKGQELIAPEEHTLLRDYTYVESAQLAKERERQILSSALANELVTVVMRRLASL